MLNWKALDKLSYCVELSSLSPIYLLDARYQANDKLIAGVKFQDNMSCFKKYKIQYQSNSVYISKLSNATEVFRHWTHLSMHLNCFRHGFSMDELASMVSVDRSMTRDNLLKDLNSGTLCGGELLCQWFFLAGEQS